LRDNGAIEGAAAGFSVGDEVIVLKKRDDTIIKVIGHTDGIKRCERYYFIHNFETAVDQPDYVWDMEEPDNYEFSCRYSSLTSDAKFGNYGLQLADFTVYYAPNATDDLDFDTPYTLEYWFKIHAPSPPTSIPTGIAADFNLARGATWTNGVYQLGIYGPNRRPYDPIYFIIAVRDIDGNDLAFDYTTTIPFSYDVWHHFAMVLTDNKFRYFFDGVKQDEFTSPSPTGFKGRDRDIWRFIGTYNHSYPPYGGLKVIIDALSITKGEKYTNNFTPPTTPPAAPAS
jgi:hypothetical protein